MEIGFDLISDLYLEPEDSFNWENKATSLYCIISGNISHDMRTVFQVLSHLSKIYQGIFFVPGLLEYKTSLDFDLRTKELISLVKKLPKVALLYHHVVIMDGIAILGANGWCADDPANIDVQLVRWRMDDINYLDHSVQKLQTHLDVKKIIIVTSCIPKKQLYFGKIPEHVGDHIYPDYCLGSDLELKISHWVFGSSDRSVDTVLNGICYVNNPYQKKLPYWPKRVSVNF